MRIAIVLCVVSASSVASADDEMVNWCTAEPYLESIGFAAASSLAGEIETSDIPTAEKDGLGQRWTTITDDNDRARGDHGDLVRRCNDAKSLADGTRARIDQFEAACNVAEPPNGCAAEESALRSEIAERHTEMVTLEGDVSAYLGRTADLESAVQTFTEDSRAALAKYFTGKRVFRLTAKTWIDGSAISEVSFRAAKLLLEQDDEPRSPSTKEDYRLYQAFVAEVTFKQGKIKKARFLPSSLEKDAGRTKVPTVSASAGLKIVLLRIKGKIYVVNQKVSISADRERVVFTRQVEGHPSLVVLSLDKLVPFGQMGTLPTIWSSLRLEVSADTSSCEGEGSSFPSHRFWVGEDACGVGSLGQVQPSEYFGVAE
jgi:hypothetical protein